MATFAVNPANGRFICAPEHPMPAGSKGRWEHTNVHEVESGSDYCARYRCEDCGHEWSEELPQ